MSRKEVSESAESKTKGTNSDPVHVAYPVIRTIFMTFCSTKQFATRTPQARGAKDTSKNAARWKSSQPVPQLSSSKTNISHTSSKIVHLTRQPYSSVIPEPSEIFFLAATETHTLNFLFRMKCSLCFCALSGNIFFRFAEPSFRGFYFKCSRICSKTSARFFVRMSVVAQRFFVRPSVRPFVRSPVRPSARPSVRS